MNQTPIEFKKLAESAELYDQSEAIGAKFGLHIDQTGELDAEIRDILNGVSESADFSKHIMERLEINRKTADEIVVEVNRAVFQSLRDRVQSENIASEAASTISTLEQVGGFNIETEKPATAAQVTPSDRENILNSLENPPQSAPMNRSTENHTEPLVDYLLKNPVGQIEQKQHVAPKVPDNLPVVESAPTAVETKVQINKPQEVPKETPKPPQRSGPDPYREIVK